MDVNDIDSHYSINNHENHFCIGEPRKFGNISSVETQGQGHNGSRRVSKLPWSPRAKTGVRASKLVNTERFYEMSTMGKQDEDIKEKKKERQQIHHSRRLPARLVKMLSVILGVNEKSSPNQSRRPVGFIFYLVTLISGITFLTSGAIFLYFEITSKFSNPSLAVSLGKATVGAYWIGLGVYSHSLSRRLFSDDKICGWIRAHAKNFLGINIAFLVSTLLVTVVGMNLYWNHTVLLRTIEFVGNSTIVREANCVSVGAKEILCYTYYYSKILFSSLCTLWNLIVICVCISVCRTHTIGIRRFQRELFNDAKLYEEYCKIQAMNNKTDIQGIEDSWEQVTGSDTGLVMDITDRSGDHHNDPPADGLGRVRNSRLLQMVTQIRKQSRARRESELLYRESRIQSDALSTSSTRGGPSVLLRSPALPKTFVMRETQMSTIAEDDDKSELEEDVNPDMEDSAVNTAFDKDVEQGLPSESDVRVRQPTNQNHTSEDSHTSMEAMLSGQAPPIMNNETLYYTFFHLSGRLQVTSRLLQRWMVTWIAFALIWCSLLMFYWMIDTFELIGLLQICGTLIGLVLLATAYAEVNFEGDRLESFVMPSDDRMNFIHYTNTAPLHMKVYSMPLNHAVISTMVAGVVITFASRIILKQMDL